MIDCKRRLTSLSSMCDRRRPAVERQKMHNWVMNLSDYQPTVDETKVLQLGLNFAAAPRVVPKEQIIAAVEKGIWQQPAHIKAIIQGKLAKCLRTHIMGQSNLSNTEHQAIRSLRSNEDISILPADKGNCTVIMNRPDYDKKMSDLLLDTSTYKRLKRDPTRKSERVLNKFVGKLHTERQCISEAVFHQLHSTDGSAPRIYGLPKIHKEGIPLRPIVSFVGTPTYNLAKYLAKVISPLVGNTEWTVSNSSKFVQEIAQLPPLSNEELMVSYDVVSLFTSVPVELAMDIASSRILNDYSLKDRTPCIFTASQRGATRHSVYHGTPIGKLSSIFRRSSHKNR
uniref:Uncharacterized protein LOC108950552 n=1 Tax=Phallusia mammillata TaxID=59560 RepID=A0A6F9DJV2_9ASCI|nr:uncharacterized protein LOC108950552 [Phallusia mammillata]